MGGGGVKVEEGNLLFNSATLYTLKYSKDNSVGNNVWST